MALVVALFAALGGGPMMANGEAWLESHLPAGGAAAQREIRLFIHVKKWAEVVAEINENFAANGCAAVRVTRDEMRGAEFSLCE